MSDIVRDLLFRASDQNGVGWTPTTVVPVPAGLLHRAADEIERLRAALDTVRASGLLIGSTTLHDRVRSAVYNAIDANPAALEEAPCSSS
jgi:hypothetical protein